jgi:hypothetical protein
MPSDWDVDIYEDEDTLATYEAHLERLNELRKNALEYARAS